MPPKRARRRLSKPPSSKKAGQFRWARSHSRLQGGQVIRTVFHICLPCIGGAEYSRAAGDHHLAVRTWRGLLSATPGGKTGDLVLSIIMRMSDCLPERTSGYCALERDVRNPACDSFLRSTSKFTRLF